MSEPVDVRLLSYGDVAERAYPAPAFSNGFEGECWTSRWCETCAHDEYIGETGPTGVAECPIIGVTIVGSRTPRELEEVSLGGLANRYRCLGYEVRDGEDDARVGLPPTIAEEAEPLPALPDIDD